MSWSNDDKKNLNRIARQTTKTPVLDSIIDIVGTMAEKEKKRNIEKENIKIKIKVLNAKNDAYIKTIDNGMEYEQSLLKLRNKYRLPAFYYLADCAEKSDTKIYNSCKHYNYENKDEYFLAVFDNSVFGSADFGLIITSRRIIIKNQPTDYPRSVDLIKIDKIMVYNNQIVINDGESTIWGNLLNTPDKKQEFCYMIKELKKMYIKYEGEKNSEKISNNGSSNSEIESKELDKTISSLRKLKELVDEGILTEEEYVAKKKKLLGI